MVQVARQAIKNGADCLGVARLTEGIELRKAGFDEPVLIFGYTPPTLADRLIEFDLTQSIWSLKTAEALSAGINASQKPIKIHLKVDTGMGRLGLLPDSRRVSSFDLQPTAGALQEVKAIESLSGTKLEGIYTHFATADCLDKTYAKEQFEMFMDFIDKLRLEGLEIPIKHAANSGAIIDMPESHLDMVRAGISIYGLYPSDEVDKSRIDLLPAMTLKAKIVNLKKVPAGFKISYGCTYETPNPTTIATVSVGYADGYNRLLSSKGHVLVREQRAPVVGRVCMDQTMLDVGHIPDIHLEDEVVIFGRQGDACITVDEIAAVLNTINYEIVSTLTDRVNRIYLE
jgi:alanine racemase